MRPEEISIHREPPCRDQCFLKEAPAPISSSSIVNDRQPNEQPVSRLQFAIPQPETSAGLNPGHNDGAAQQTASVTEPAEAQQETANTLSGPPRTRAEISRENSLKSTGPRTVEGKARSRFNARRHNLTGQTILNADDDMTNYFAGSARLKADFDPQGEFEIVLVQSLADAQWQLDRARTIETNILFGAASKLTNEHDETRDFEADWANAQATAFLENAKQLDLMSRYATRYHRQVLQIHDRLRQVQKERRKQEQETNLERKRKHNDEPRKHQQAAQNQCDKGTSGFVSQPESRLRGAANPRPTAADNQGKSVPEIVQESIQNGKNKAA